MAMFGMLARRAASTPSIFMLQDALDASFRSAPTGDAMRPRSPPPTPAAAAGATAAERIGGSCAVPSIGAAAVGSKNAGLVSGSTMAALISRPGGATSRRPASWISSSCVGGGGATSGRTTRPISPACVGGGAVTSGRSASWILPTCVGGGGTTELSVRRAVGDLASGSKVAALTSEGGGALSSRTTTPSSRPCVGSGAPYGLAGTGLHSFGSGLFTSSHASWSVEKKFSTCTTTSWSSVEEKLAVCIRSLKLLQEQSSTNQKLLQDNLDLSRQIHVMLSSLGKGASYTSTVIRCTVGILVLYAMVSLLVMATLLILGVKFEDAKGGLGPLVSRAVHQVLNNEDLKRDLESYSVMLGCSIRRVFFSWRNPNVISRQEFATKVTQFAHAALTLIAASNGKCSQAPLLKKMKAIGFNEEDVNLQMLKFLVKKGYLKKETVRTVHFYSFTPDMIQFCQSGEMQKSLVKDVKKIDSLEKMLLAQD